MARRFPDPEQAKRVMNSLDAGSLALGWVLVLLGLLAILLR